MAGNDNSITKVAGNTQQKVGLVYDETMCKHDTPDGEDHPECPDRIRVIWKKLQLAGVAQRCVVLGSRKVEDKHLQLVHTKDHVNFVKSISTKRKDGRRKKIASRLDSIYLNGGSSEAAYLAAGSVVEIAEKVAEGELDSGFAIVRPPGHHAEADEAMGFCLFNNIAVAASYLLNERHDLGVNKILLVDWDVHHGNGIQKMFWKDPRVLFFSLHRHDSGFYPEGDDGDYNMVGEGRGEGFNINVPWDQASCGDADYLAAWDHILIPVAKEFKPDIVLLSAGFDAAIGDPLGGCCVTPYGYSVMLKKLMEFGRGKIVMALEGGYNLDSTAKSSLACVQVLLDDKPIQGSSEAYPFESTLRVIQAVRKRLCTYWPSLADDLSWNLINQKTPTPSILISSSNSETKDDAHGILDKISQLNIENHQGAAAGSEVIEFPRVQIVARRTCSEGDYASPTAKRMRLGKNVIEDSAPLAASSAGADQSGSALPPASYVHESSNSVVEMFRMISEPDVRLPPVVEQAQGSLYSKTMTAGAKFVAMINELSIAYQEEIKKLQNSLMIARQTYELEAQCHNGVKAERDDLAKQLALAERMRASSDDQVVKLRERLDRALLELKASKQAKEQASCTAELARYEGIKAAEAAKHEKDLASLGRERDELALKLALAEEAKLAACDRASELASKLRSLKLSKDREIAAAVSFATNKLVAEVCEDLNLAKREMEEWGRRRV